MVALKGLIVAVQGSHWEILEYISLFFSEIVILSQVKVIVIEYLIVPVTPCLHYYLVNYKCKLQ